MDQRHADLCVRREPKTTAVGPSAAVAAKSATAVPTSATSDASAVTHTIAPTAGAISSGRGVRQAVRRCHLSGGAGAPLQLFGTDGL